MAAPICRPCVTAPKWASIAASDCRLNRRNSFTNESNKRFSKFRLSNCTSNIKGSAFTFSYHGISFRCSGTPPTNPQRNEFSWKNCAMCIAMAATIATMLPSVTPASSFDLRPVIQNSSLLISGPPIKDPKALLRYALPIDNKPISVKPIIEIQKSLEDIKVPGTRALDSVGTNVRQPSHIFNQNKPAIIASIAEAMKDRAQELLDKFIIFLQDFRRIVEAQDRVSVAPKQQELLDLVGG